MGIPAGMVSLLILELRSVIVVYSIARASGQDATFIMRLHPSPRMHFQIGERGSTGTLNPGHVLGHAHPCLVQVSRFGSLYQRCFDLCMERSNRRCYLLDGFHHCPLPNRLPIQVGDDLARALDRNVMNLVEGDHLRLERRPILHPLRHVFGKGSFVHFSTPGAGFDFCTMFGDFHAHRRDVKDLSPFITAHRRFFQGSMALLTTAHPMNLDMVWMRHEFQGMSRMSRLGANVLPTGLAQRAVFGCFRPSLEGGLLLLRLFLASWSSSA